jgi:hypothetical protein
MDFYKGLLLLGYYVCAAGALYIAVTRDHAATRVRVAAATGTGPSRAVDAFLGRVAAVVGALAGGGIALLLALLDPPLVSGWWIAPIAVLDAVVTRALVLLCVRVLRGRFGIDVVAELRDDTP